jgi:HEAT repeat protein
MGALKDADPHVRRQAAWALGEIADPRAAGPLASALKDASAEVRRQAAWALGEMEE